jgi:hypothetical protein
MGSGVFVMLIWRQVMQRRICCCKQSLSIIVGAFDDSKVKQLMNLSKQEMPVYLIAVGNP